MPHREYTISADVYSLGRLFGAVATVIREGRRADIVLPISAEGGYSSEAAARDAAIAHVKAQIAQGQTFGL